jgi:hypothetical protein
MLVHGLGDGVLLDRELGGGVNFGMDEVFSSDRCGNEVLKDLVNEGDGNIFRRRSACLSFLKGVGWA